MKKLIIHLVILFPLSFAWGQYLNYRLYPSTPGVHQIEPWIVRHPTNPQVLFASAFTIYTSFRSEGIYVSTDGGQTWRGTDTCNGAPISGHGGDPGPVIDKDGRFILTHQGGSFVGMYSNYSTNSGLNWTNNYQIAGNDQDKGNPATDDVPSSPYYGRTFLVWTRFTPPFPIVISYTTTGAQSWIPFLQINNTPAGHLSYGPTIVAGYSGNVYVSWASSINTSPFTEDFVGFARSSDGGNTWDVTENAFDCNGIRTTQLVPWNIRTNGFPSMDVDKSAGPRSGWIYITTPEKNLPPAGSDPDIIFHRSTDGGQSWSAGIRVNQDPLNNGRNQFFPAVRVDEQGGVNILYYDNRNTADSCEVWLSRSTNGGNTWTDAKVSDHRFKPAPVSGAGSGNMGDNIGMTSGNGKLYPVWMDNSTGTFQIWSATIDYTTFGITKIGSGIPKDFELSQNYPNPFNPTTKIRFDIPPSIGVRGMKALIIVYDILGREITSLVNEELNPGTYEVDWNASGYPSGVYYYRFILTAGGKASHVNTKKMVLIR